MTQIRDDPTLLEAMMCGAEQKATVWQPTSYWRGYCRRIVGELHANGLRDVRVNQAILKGFAAGGTLRPTEPAAGWKRAIWRRLERLPGVARVIAEYGRVVRAEHRHHVNVRIRLARLLIDRIATDFPDLAPPQGLGNGGAEDTFEWRGHQLTADWLTFLVRAAAFYRVVQPRNVCSMLELGPGLGLSTLAHIALNPEIKLIVNVDVPPVLYVATQYLRTIDGVNVVDYSDIPETGAFTPAPTGDRVTVYQIAPWQLPRLSGSIHLFHNAYSFQEMEQDICANYAKTVTDLITKHVWLMSAAEGHLPGAGGQREPIPIDFLAGLFRDAYPNDWSIDDDLLALYSDPRESIVLSREA